MPARPSSADRLRRLVSPTYGARSNAEDALQAITASHEDAVLRRADFAALTGHPAGQGRRSMVGRLGTALWEVFPGHVALIDRQGVVVSVNRAWREFGLANGSPATTGLGMNYLDVCDRAAE